MWNRLPLSACNSKAYSFGRPRFSQFVEGGNGVYLAASGIEAAVNKLFSPSQLPSELAVLRIGNDYAICLP